MGLMEASNNRGNEKEWKMLGGRWIWESICLHLFCFLCWWQVLFFFFLFSLSSFSFYLSLCVCVGEFKRVLDWFRTWYVDCSIPFIWSINYDNGFTIWPWIQFDDGGPSLVDEEFWCVNNLTHLLFPSYI